MFKEGTDMFTSQCDYLKTVKESINGARPIDEDTLSSVAVLAERLERLKKTSSLFADVAFSDDVQELADCELISAIS
ncbi:MAG: hypothetical protein DRP66_05970 [Planctomycetota bacterium]|nr:MAG: hypothetical protein DRP66_05970 [Planctomycetota bacterium]